MYACKQCGTGNPLDSSFCKKCGTALPENELAEARVKLNEMLEEGNNLFTDGRTDEAMLIAEAAVAANPSSHMAHSLKGLCHERMGQISEALECYETAVGLNPDSSLDKVKVAALRNRLAQRVADLGEPNPRRAAIMAGSAMAVVLVLGCLVAIGMSGRHDPAKAAANTSAETQQTNQQFINPQNSGQPANGTTTGGGAGTTANPNPGTTQSGTGPSASPYVGPPGLNTVLPPATTEFGPGTIPISVEPTGHLTTEAPKPGIDPPPTAINPPKGSVETQAPPDDSGYVDVQVSKGKPKTLGGSEPADDGHAVGTMLQAASQLFQTNHFDQAASKYAKVAEMGGNTARVQQRLGDCYRNLGKSEQSRAAYNRAINMFQTQIKQGRDVAGNQRGLDSCEAQLKVLGG